MSNPQPVASGPAPSSTPRPDHELVSALSRAALIDQNSPVQYTPLTGGVSSDIWLVEQAAKRFCVKRALTQLKVDKEWLAPIERNRYEVAWLRVAGEVVPEAVPKVFWHDDQAMILAMDFLPPEDYQVWKHLLRDGHVDLSTATLVGQRLGRIHAATADRADLAELFPRTDIFHAIRLEPYLEATAAEHPDLRETLFGLSKRTATTRRVMVHGDVSPKNILIGPNGPVILDAECACIGDPAFDLAFCLNHLLLKCLWNPAASSGYLAGFDALSQAYLEQVHWEPAAALETRAASLLPGLLLARVDGKSPVEYLSEAVDLARVRDVARALLKVSPSSLAEVSGAWTARLHNDGFSV